MCAHAHANASVCWLIGNRHYSVSFGALFIMQNVVEIIFMLTLSQTPISICLTPIVICQFVI